ncbi:MAG TPA: DUF4476 domain-containing protein [Chitinophagaceae bacterium]|nr:DUF4476 domain-containing protein [Chitinophagaceae bacterium]
MKKLLLVFVLGFVFQPSFASWRKCMLRLRHDMGRNISVEIDGKRFDKMGRSLTIGDLAPGIHRIKIYKYNTNGHGYRTGILTYQGTLRFEPGKIYYGTVSGDRLEVEENCCLDDYGHWNNNDRWDATDRWNDPQKPSYDENEDLSWNNNNNWNHDDHHDRYTENNWDQYNGSMSEGRFNELLNQVRKASFENSKVSVAKQALKTNRINCKQLLTIINEFSFESTKLQFAKDAYKRVTDRNNYFILNDAFTFQSSKDELLEFLEKAN